MVKILQFKDGVRIKRLTPGLFRIWAVLDELQNRYEWIPELTITSVNDSVHKDNSSHYSDRACDVRSHNFTIFQDKLHFIEALAQTLGPKFTILFENQGTANEHFHVMVKNGVEYP